MVKREKILILVLLLSAFFYISSVSAASGANYTFVLPSNGLVERAANNFFNITIGAVGSNITFLQINFTGGQVGDPNLFVLETNGSNTDSLFANSSFASGVEQSSSQTLTLTFTNSSGSLIQNGTTKNFWFNITTKSQSSSLLQLTMFTSNGTDTNITSSSFGFSFRFSGYVKNESGGFHNGTNVTMYQYTQVPMGPPVESAVASVLSDENGSFTFTGLNSSGGLMYTMKMIYYNSTGTATKIGTILPPFPAEMYYPFSFGQGQEPEFEFMKPPSLNGSTFYLGSAATVFVNATNGSTLQRFGYMLMDQKTGLPIASNMFGNVSNVSVIVPLNKRYTIMAVRANQQFAMYNNTICNGNFMNDTACMTPPRSNSTINPTIEGQQTNVQLNLAVQRVQMYGCLAVSGNLSAITNITSIIPKMLPWEGFVPPMRADTQDINLSNTGQLNYSDSRCSGKIAWYNISLLNSNYLVEFYGAKNASTSNSTEHVGAFQNVSYSSLSAGNNTMQNITLAPLGGSFASGQSDVNTTKLKINIQNASGGAITQDTPHIDLFVREPNSFGELTYIIQETTNGTFYIALPQNATAKAKIFSNNAPPKEKTLNLSLSEVNITLISMTGGDGGFRKINSSGGIEAMNITSSSFAMQMRFIKAGGNCDGLYPDNTTCVLTSTSATGFNPMSAMVAGTINMEMKMSSTNVSITFYNFDMFSAKQPPMESVMNDQASGGSANAPAWQFGSFVPSDVYDYAIIAMPYSDTNINDSADVNMSVSNLYDENWNVVWNSTRGDTSANFTNNIDEYLGNVNNRSYNSTGYRNFTVSGGVACSKTDANLNGTTPSSYCFVNTTSNIMYMRVPHFSGVAPLVTASAPASAGTAGNNNPGGSGPGADTTSFWKSTFAYDSKNLNEREPITRELNKQYRIKFKLENEIHYVGIINLTNTSATINVSSTSQQAVFAISEEKKFEINDDSYYDVLVKLNGINNNKANITISYLHELIPQQSDQTINNSVSPVNESQDGSTTTAGEGEENEKRIWPWIVIGVLVLIAAGAILFYFFYLKKESYKYHHRMNSFYG